MSDELVKRLRNTPNWMREEYGHYKDGLKVYDRAPFEAADALDAQTAEITRLRAAINNALLEPWLDGQLNGTWHQEPIGPNETPEEAVKRLVSVRAEWAVYKNNCENPEIAELRAALATARREGMEEAAQVLEELHRNHKYNPKTGEGREHDVGYYRAISEGVAHILYAAKEDRNP
jgi:transglutaminase-like putative cysteine protease